MPKKSIKKIEPLAFSPKVEESANRGIIAFLAICCVVFMFATINLAIQLDKSTSLLKYYKIRDLERQDREEFKRSCRRLKQLSPDFIYGKYSGYCFNSTVTIETKEEVEEAIRHYELGSGK